MIELSKFFNSLLPFDLEAQTDFDDSPTSERGRAIPYLIGGGGSQDKPRKPVKKTKNLTKIEKEKQLHPPHPSRQPLGATHTRSNPRARHGECPHYPYQLVLMMEPTL
jgi:hypothetical protein